MGEKLKNAPVYFTIVQAKFNAVLALDSYLPQIQEGFRQNGLPDFQKNVVQTLNLNFGPSMPSAPIEKAEQYFFLNEEKAAGFILNQTSLSYQATEYETFEVFSRHFIEGLKRIHQIVGLSYVDRLGFRYLDAVVPKADEKLEQYLNPCVLGLYGKLAGDLGHSFTETVTVTPLGKVVSRAIIQKGKLGFPPDLQPVLLKVNERFQAIDEIHAILDTDGWFEGREKFDIKLIQNRIKAIHIQIMASFRATVTEYAMKVWDT